MALYAVCTLCLFFLCRLEKDLLGWVALVADIIGLMGPKNRVRYLLYPKY